MTFQFKWITKGNLRIWDLHQKDAEPRKIRTVNKHGYECEMWELFTLPWYDPAWEFGDVMREVVPIAVVTRTKWGCKHMARKIRRGKAS